MGTSGAMNTSNQYIKYKITINQNWQSVGENYSNVTVKVNFYRTNTGYTSYGSGTVYCKINGTTYTASVSTSQKITNSGIDLFSKTLNIYHNNDGTKTLTCSAWISHDVVSSSEQSYSQTLTRIPRTSTIASINGNTLGSPITVNINRASDIFTHKVFYKRTDGQRFEVGSGVGTSHTFTPSIDDCNLLPNSTSGTAEITVDTYYGDTYIGYNAWNITVYVPSNITPSIGDITLTEAVGGIAAKFGGLVQWKSKAKVSVNAWGSYSSTIKSYSIKMNGATYTSKSFTTDYLKSGGDCVVTVKDSRGRSASKTVGFSATAYWNPWIDTFSVSRCNADGTANDSGNCAKCVIKAGVAPIDDKNDRTFIVQYKKQSESAYKSVQLYSDHYTLETTQIITDIDTESEYEFILNTKDYFSTTKLSRNVSTAYTLVDYNASGRGIAFGKVSTGQCLEINMDTHMNNYLHLGESNNEEKRVYYTNLAAAQGQTTEVDGVRPHNVWLVGGAYWDNLAFKIWDQLGQYCPLGYEDSTKRLYYGTEGLWSGDGNGTFLDKWGNICTQHAMDAGHWVVANNGVDYLKVEWGSKQLFGAIGNVYQAKELYYNGSGTTGSITLSDSANNYTFMDIVYKTNDNYRDTTRLNPYNGEKLVLQGALFYGGHTMYYKAAGVTINGTSITWDFNGEAGLTSGTTTVVSGNLVYIIRVVGYK